MSSSIARLEALMNAPRQMLSLDDALARLVAGSTPYAITQTENVSTFDALGRVLAADVLSPLNVPPEDNTSMDGYALRAADVTTAGTVLTVAQRIPAGHVGRPLLPGTAARIFTGGQVPAGADAVVMQEQCEALAGTVGESLGAVRVNAVPSSGQWIRRRGEDVAVGDVVLRAGERLTPQSLGLAASAPSAPGHLLYRR
jgi:molybdopterin molybdotransferase